MRTTNMKPITALDAVRARKPIVESVFDALNDGRIAEAVAQFDDHFTFTDQALDLEFTDKGRLLEFFQKPASFSGAPWWKWIPLFSAETTSLPHGSLRQRRLCPVTDPHACEFQFPCEECRSLILTAERLPSGPTTTTKIDLGGSVWPRLSKIGLSTKKLFATSVLRRSPLTDDQEQCNGKQSKINR